MGEGEAGWVGCRARRGRCGGAERKEWTEGNPWQAHDAVGAATISYLVTATCCVRVFPDNGSFMYPGVSPEGHHGFILIHKWF